MSLARSERGDGVQADFLAVSGRCDLCVRGGYGRITADGFEGDPVECDEGELEWVDKKDIAALELWEGDKIFFRLLDMGREFFSLKLVYDRQDVLQYAALDGVPMELFDEIREDGSRTGVVKERGVVHEDGTLHATVHIWIVRPNDRSGYDLLLQKRSDCKDSNPGCWDISSAGHIEAGHGRLESALRELKEELGIDACQEQLREAGTRRCGFESEFYGRLFRDNELSTIYIYEEPVEIGNMTLQESEVSEVEWMDFGECRKKVSENTFEHCIYEDEELMAPHEFHCKEIQEFMQQINETFKEELEAEKYVNVEEWIANNSGIERMNLIYEDGPKSPDIFLPFEGWELESRCAEYSVFGQETRDYSMLRIVDRECEKTCDFQP